MEIRQLKSFQSVATHLSFNRAAEQLNYAQSSISAQIQTLEDELGVKLFDRLGRRIQRTEAGERLLRYSNKIIELAAEAKADVGETKGLQGTLTVRIPDSFGVHRLPLIISQFLTRFPRAHLKFNTCAHEGLERDLRKGITDLAFLYAESVQAKDLEAEALTFESLCLVGHPGHPLVKRERVATRDIAGEIIVLSNVDCSYRRILEQTLEQENVKAGTLLEFNSVAAVKACVRKGIGISLLPKIAVSRDLAEGTLALLPWEEENIEVALLMIRYRERWISPTLKAFMDVVRECMPER